MTTGPSTAVGGSSDEQSTTQQLTGQTQETAQELTGQAKEQAQQVAERARHRLREQLDLRSSEAGEQITAQASDLRSVSETLRDQGKQGPANAAGKLAEYAERVGGYLRERDSDALVADAEDLGRRQPWAIAGGGLVLGVVAARFLKASSRRRYSSRLASSDGERWPAHRTTSAPLGTPSTGRAPDAAPKVPPTSPMPPTPATPASVPRADAAVPDPTAPIDPPPIRTTRP